MPVDGDAVENTFLPLLIIGVQKFLTTFLISTLHCLISGLESRERGLSINSLNVNSICSHLGEIKLLMNEIKINSDYPSELTAITGYQED